MTCDIDSESDYTCDLMRGATLRGWRDVKVHEPTN